MTVLDRPATPLESLGKGFESVLPYLAQQKVLQAQKEEAALGREWRTSERVAGAKTAEEVAAQKVVDEERIKSYDFGLKLQGLGITEQKMVLDKMDADAEASGDVEIITKVAAAKGSFINALTNADPTKSGGGIAAKDFNFGGADDMSVTRLKLIKVRAKQNKLIEIGKDPRGLTAEGAEWMAEQNRRTTLGEGLDEAPIPHSGVFNPTTKEERAGKIDIQNIATAKAQQLDVEATTQGRPSKAEAEATRKAEIGYKKAVTAASYAGAALDREKLKYYPAEIQAKLMKANADAISAQQGAYKDRRDVVNTSMGIMFGSPANKSKGTEATTGLMNTILNPGTFWGKEGKKRTMENWVKNKKLLSDPTWKKIYDEDAATFKTTAERKLLSLASTPEIQDQVLTSLKAFGYDWWTPKSTTPTGQIVVVDKAGKRYSIPKEEEAEAIKQGYKLETKK